MQGFANRVDLARRSVSSRHHEHSWLRRRDMVGMFRCAGCHLSAVCPGCLNSIDVALCVDRGIDGLVLYWCPLHRPGAADQAWRVR